METTLPALPSGWIERLFGRFSALYGKHWLELWTDVPMVQVMSTWEDALRGTTGDQIRQALEYVTAHNKFPPTCPEFVALCREFRPTPEYQPPPSIPALPMPKYDAVEFERKRDGKDWARDILALHKAGRYPSLYGLECAMEVFPSEAQRERAAIQAEG